MCFTKTLKLFKGPGPACWNLHIFELFFVYPYHHSSKQPQNLVKALVEKGSAMYLQWGATFQAYKDSDW